MKTYADTAFRSMAKSSPVYQEHIADEWFKRFATLDGVYNQSHVESLRTWLIRFRYCPAPQKEKQEAKS
jgi:hypothetical protein